eukprot:GHVS01039006.1.p1 GENE.GHVS01039006.1~~GHVS01039006.1.p1  ORF type:complete len:288 (+),score=36.05 GHVS01039006.1:73-936(+)
MCLWSLICCCCGGSRNKLHTVVVGAFLLAPLLFAQLIYIGCHSSHDLVEQEDPKIIPEQETPKFEVPSFLGEEKEKDVWLHVLRSLSTKFIGYYFRTDNLPSSTSFYLSDDANYPCPVLPKYLHWQLLHEHFPALRDSLKSPSVWLYQNSVALLPPQTARPLALAAVTLTIYFQTLILLLLAVYLSWRLVLAPLVQVCWWLFCLALVVVGLFKLLRLTFTLYGSEVVTDQQTQDFLTEVFDHINQTMDSLFFWLISLDWRTHLATVLVRLSSFGDFNPLTSSTHDEL